MTKEEKLKQECEKFVNETISELEPKFKLLESFEKDSQSLNNLKNAISEKLSVIYDKIKEIKEITSTFK
jgi:flagellar motility protein MotE (MotC chaperone)